nr:Na+/H+ antiporter [Cellulosimicrobium arenosum]
MLAGIVVLTPLADRVRIPAPVLLTVFGLAVPLVPGVPELRLDPEYILPVVLPPLLFAATQRASVHDYRRNASPILLLAVGLTIATAACAAVVAHALGLPWGPAIVLGAVIAPPDPVAATAVARRLRLPGRMVAVLEGEGMFNDATALVMYNLAVAAVVAGGVSAGEIGLELVLAIVVGIVVGLVAGGLTRLALRYLHQAAPETVVTIAVPFAVYLGAEELGGSGVLAVLALGLYLRVTSHDAVTSAGWLLGRSVWDFADFLITSFVFVFIGFELTAVLRDGSDDRTATIWTALALAAVLVVVRFAWVFPVTWLRRLARGAGRPGAEPASTPEATVVSWAGMRGVVTVASALALPHVVDGGGDFPHRSGIVFIALVCVLVTLVLQGLTLAPLVKALRVGSESDSHAEAATLRREAAVAGLYVVRDATEDDDGKPYPDRVRRAVELQYEGRIDAQDALLEARHGADHDEGDDGDERAVEDLLRRGAEAERDHVIEARGRGQVSAEAADTVLDDVETRAVREML